MNNYPFLNVEQQVVLVIFFWEILTYKKGIWVRQIAHKQTEVLT